MQDFLDMIIILIPHYLPPPPSFLAEKLGVGGGAYDLEFTIKH